MSGEARLQKIIARAGLASRRRAEAMIEEGRVTVDGAVVKTLGARCDPALHDIRVDGVRVKADRARRYVVIHKPRGYLTTRRDPGRRPTVMELLPISLRTLFPVGRLDMTTSGLLLLSDDGEFALRMTHPRFGIEKGYLATVRGVPSQDTLERLRRGIRVGGEWMKIGGVELLHHKEAEAFLRITLREGKYREVRRMLEAVGHPVLKLHRDRIGTLTDKGLPAGAFRPLTSREVEKLLTATQEPSARAQRPSDARPTEKDSESRSERSLQPIVAGGGAPATRTRWRGAPRTKRWRPQPERTRRPRESDPTN